MKTKKQQRGYLDLLQRARKTRHFIAENPGLTYEAIRKGLYPMDAPLAWLYKKGYVSKEGGVMDAGGGRIKNLPVTYFVVKMGDLG